MSLSGDYKRPRDAETDDWSVVVKKKVRSGSLENQAQKPHLKGVQNKISSGAASHSIQPKLNAQVTHHVQFRNDCLSKAANLSREEVVSALGKLSYFLEGQDLCLDEACQEDKQLYQMLQNKIEVFGDSYKAKELVDVAIALAKLEIHSPKLFEFISNQSRLKIMHFGTKELSHLAWAFAKSGNKNPDLFRAIAITSGIKMSAFQPHEVAKLAWAFAVIDLADINKEFFGKLIKHLPTQSALYNDKDCMQVKQFQLYLTKIKGVDPQWDPAFQKRIDDAAAAESASGGHPSNLQLRVEHAVAKTIPHGAITREYIDPESAYSIDFMLHVDNIHYAFEVDGPAHFVQLEGQPVYNRTSQFKTEILSKHINLIRIPHYEWQALRSDQAQKEYILKAMELNGYKPTDNRKADLLKTIVETIGVVGETLADPSQVRTSRSPSIRSNDSTLSINPRDLGYSSEEGSEKSNDGVSTADKNEVKRQEEEEIKESEVETELKPVQLDLKEVKVEPKVATFQSKVIMGLWITASLGFAAMAAYLVTREEE